LNLKQGYTIYKGRKQGYARKQRREDMEPLAAVILINYNGYKDTLECIKSLNNIDYPNYIIIVIDNGSTQQPLESELDYIKKHCFYVYSEHNLGFSGGCNLGIEHARMLGAEFVLLLNNDTTVEKDFLNQLFDLYYHKSHVGVIGGLILYYYQPDFIWYGGGSFDYHLGLAKHDLSNCMRANTSVKTREVTFVTGCLMLIPIGVFDDIGPFDESFFLYSEDAEFCCRVHKAGYKMFFCPKAVIYHKVNASSGSSSYMMQYYMTRNNLYMIKKYADNRAKGYFIFIFREIRNIIRNQKDIRPLFHAALDFVRGVRGMSVKAELKGD